MTGYRTSSLINRASTHRLKLGSPRLGVHVIRPNRVHLNIRGVGGQQLFVDVISVPSYSVLLLVEAGLIFDLPEWFLRASAHRLEVVHTDLVVLIVQGFFDEGFLSLLAYSPVLDDDVIIALLDLVSF